MTSRASISLAEDDDAPNYSHYEGGMSAEEDERWARWAGDVVGRGEHLLLCSLISG